MRAGLVVARVDESGMVFYKQSDRALAMSANELEIAIEHSHTLEIDE